jgi:radical SAM superfamily enzyme YgiQ (UPF0313 family)
MTFQRRTALRLIGHVRRLRPETTIVVGGYDPSLAPEAYADPTAGVDVVVRGEGEHAFRELLRAMEECRDFSHIPGLSWRRDGRMLANPDRAVASLKNGDINLPKRSARVLDGYTLLGRQVDVIETSRGCTYDCSFCSIIEMRGRNFHTFDFTRVLADITDARAHGARTIFMVDDNITLDVRRFEALCRAIIDAGLSDLDYVVQGMTSAIAEHGETLAPLMRKAGFRYVFLGIENVLSDDLVFLKARAKNARREGGRTIGNASIEAIAHLHRHGMFVVGGLIVGNPDDTPEAIETNLAFARQYVDWPYIQHPTPYPRTPMTRDFRERGLIVSEALEEYDGTTAVVRTAHLRAGRRRVHAMEGGAVDEGAAHPGGAETRPVVRVDARPADVRAHVPRKRMADVARPGTGACCVRTVSGIAPAGAGVCPAGRARGGRRIAAGAQARAADVTSAGIATSAARGAEARRTRRHHHHRHDCRRRPPASAARRSPRCGDRRAPCR